MNPMTKAEVSALPGDYAENPLMKLVDAAGYMRHSEVTVETAPMDSIAISNCFSQSDCNEGKIIIGTKDDLYKSNKKVTFAQELMDILDDEANSEAIAWMPDGESFTIVNHRLFAMDRMPKLFNIRNMSSFVRKLTRWGFTRVHEKSTRNSDIFKHDMFQRGRRDLLKKIRCVYRPAAQKPMPEIEAHVGKEVDHRMVEEQYPVNHPREPTTCFRLSRPMATPPCVRTIPNYEDEQPVFPSARPASLPPLPPCRIPPSRPASLDRRPAHQGILDDVTSRVVSAAIEALRRDEYPIAHHPQVFRRSSRHTMLQQTMMQQQRRQSFTSSLLQSRLGLSSMERPTFK
jgi:hypothetical protein